MNQFIETSKNILDLPLYIDETPAITISALCNRELEGLKDFLV